MDGRVRNDQRNLSEDPAVTEGRQRARATPFTVLANPEQMQSIIATHLLPPDVSSMTVVDCVATFVRRGDSRGLGIYQVTLQNEVTGAAWTEIVSAVAYGGQRTQRAWKRISKTPRKTACPAHGLKPAAYAPAQDLLLQVFPFDYQLPALAPLLAGAHADCADVLLARFEGSDWKLESWEADVIRYRPDLRVSVRLTLGASACGQTTQRRFYAKIFADRKEMERIARNQRRLVHALADASRGFVVADIAAALPAEKLLILDEVSGVSLIDLLSRRASGDSSDGETAVRRAARALAALHQLPIQAPALRQVVQRGSAENTRQEAAGLKRQRPELAGLIDDVARRVLARLESAGDIVEAPIHGDLKPEHIIFNDEHVALLDFDKFTLGDPLIDVTSMLLRSRRGGRGNGRMRLGSSGRPFVEEYCAHVPAVWSDRLAPIYAAALLREAARGEETARDRQGRRTGDEIVARRTDYVQQLLQEASDLMIAGQF